jgi:integral membrane sensor domain MASE1
MLRGGDLLNNITGWVLNDILGMLTIGPACWSFFKAGSICASGR